MKLSELSDETLLYIEIFNDLKNIIPEVKVVTKKEYVSNQDLFRKGYWYEIFIAIISPVSFFLEDFLEQAENENGLGDGWGNKVIDELRNTIDIDEFEYKINEVLMRHPNYIAGESVENDVWRERQMKKAKLEEYLGKQVKITLFNKDIITGVLHKTGEEQFKRDPNLYIPRNCYFCINSNSEVDKCIFKVSHIRKLEELDEE